MGPYVLQQTPPTGIPSGTVLVPLDMLGLPAPMPTTFRGDVYACGEHDIEWGRRDMQLRCAEGELRKTLQDGPRHNEGTG